ncbi:MAG TPA: hypothetical protein VL068_14590 [Microthrixaceae bacterium]|nr:hypothetical protein [Microthrixaceae bacterium]
MNSTDDTTTDPVFAKREKIRKFCDVGSQFGYSCFGVAVVMFVVAYLIDFPAWSVTIVLASMLIGSIVLLPAIVLGYGVKAADADDKGEKFGY